MPELINTSLEELKQGFVLDREKGAFVCSICGKAFDEEEVYPSGDRFLTAKRAVKTHIAAEHGDLFTILCGFDKRYTGLTPNQRELLTLMHAGLSDAQIASRMGVTASTIRHQRFTFRERAKQARMYLAIYELACRGSTGEELIEIPSGASMLDERYETTAPEEEKILSTQFYSLHPLRLRVFSAKEKKKVVVLRRILEEFERSRFYTEKEVNDVLRPIYADYVTLRRYLIEYGFLDRERDGSAYWVKGSLPDKAPTPDSAAQQ